MAGITSRIIYFTAYLEDIPIIPFPIGIFYNLIATYLFHLT